LGALAQNAADLLQGIRRARPDVGFIEIEQDVGRQFDAGLGRGLLDLQRLHPAAQILDPVVQVEHVSGQFPYRAARVDSSTSILRGTTRAREDDEGEYDDNRSEERRVGKE